MPALAYKFKDALYLNITNICPCACTFCLRDDFGTVGDADTLWLDHEPSAPEVIAAVQAYELLKTYSEVVFCGFGEPFSSYDVMIQVAQWLKDQGVEHVRVNTNGLGDLIVGRPVASELAGLIDELSISLNAPDAESYNELCIPEFGQRSFQAVLDFAEAAKEYVPQVTLSVVDFLNADEVQRCADTAESLELPLRVRQFS
ncbi:MAG: TatD family nuclease-associated radical SAM protein [Coriobacteriia bacterium]|nr:TatD family nuclease-associated radical SAM protein [Coriobacteriia bacterium]MCL2870582.1 TatD family nuclease-associated radical SAM protein [Coriobacteriia bacterium]